MNKDARELIIELYNKVMEEEREDKNKIMATDLTVKQKIQIGDYTWSVFGVDDFGNKRLLLDKEYAEESVFGDNNNYSTSTLRKRANNCAAAEHALELLGKESFIPQSIDLFSHDGFRDYGICEGDIFGIMNYDTYRNNRENIDPSYMWLSTPDSTPSGTGDLYVQYVNSCGYVDYGGCGCGGGVRPDLILKSSIFVSLVEE